MVISQFVHILDIISLFAAEFEEPKIGISGKGLDRVMKLDLQPHVMLQHICKRFQGKSLSSL